MISPVRIARFWLPRISLLQAPLMVAIRIWLALVFWKSGLVKLDDWEATVTLFAEEYKVPILQPGIAAVLGTAVELSAPVLLVTGFGARIGAAMLLGMTAVIQFTYQSNPDHLVWALFAGLIFTHGAGCWSWDHFIRRAYLRDTHKNGAVSLNLALVAAIALTALVVYEVLQTFVL